MRLPLPHSSLEPNPSETPSLRFKAKLVSESFHISVSLLSYKGIISYLSRWLQSVSQVLSPGLSSILWSSETACLNVERRDTLSSLSLDSWLLLDLLSTEHPFVVIVGWLVGFCGQLSSSWETLRRRHFFSASFLWPCFVLTRTGNLTLQCLALFRAPVRWLLSPLPVSQLQKEEACVHHEELCAVLAQNPGASIRPSGFGSLIHCS